MTVSQIFRILWARRRLCFTVFFIVVGAVATVSLLMPKEYVAEISLVVDIKGGDPLNDGSLAPALVPTYLGTQTEIIRSRKVALKVIDSLGLATDLATLELYRAQGGTQDVRDWLVGPVLKDLEAKTTRNSNIIRIGYTSTNPEVAAAMANGFADAYIEAILELKVDPSRRQAIWFDEQVQQLRQDLGDAQAKLSKYQSDFGVLGVDDARLDVENARLQEISNHLVSVQAAMYDAETRRAQLTSSRANPEEAPDLLKHPVIQSLKSELARAEGKLAELGGRYDRNHPQFRSAAAEVASLRSKLDAEINLARGSLVQTAQIARRQVDEVQRALEEQKDRIIALKRQRDELSVLHRDVESARSAYDAALQQATKTRLESRIDRTNVAILNGAVVPTSPAAPRVALNVAVAMIAGTLLAMGIALTLELHNRRLRFRDDLIADADIPVLAELPRLNAPRRRARAPALRASTARLRTNVA